MLPLGALLSAVEYSEHVHPAKARAIHPYIVPLSSLPTALVDRCAPLLEADGLRVANVSHPRHGTSFLMAVRGFHAGDAISTTIAWKGRWEGIQDARDLMAPRHKSGHSPSHDWDAHPEMRAPIPPEVQRAFAGGDFPALPPTARKTFVDAGANIGARQSSEC
jgi:hypothetical protein